MNGILANIITVVINPLIVLGISIALIVFIYGIVRFIAKMSDETVRDEGKRAMVYGLVGLVIMISVFGIIRIVLKAVGLDNVPLLF